MSSLNPKDLSPKQDHFYRRSRAFFNIADGAVRSGKTHSCLWRFFVHSQTAPPGELMVLGKTRDTVMSNVVGPLSDMLGPRRVRFSYGSGRLVLAGRPVRVVGVNDAQAETKIRGATLAGSYCNELTLFEERAFRQLWDRHSVPGAKMFADTNPDTPFHWLYRGFLTNEYLTPEDMFRVRFSLDDNPVLTEEYKERLSRAHPEGSVWHRRNVLGEWVQAQGAVYEQWAEEVHVVDTMPSAPDKVVVGIDHGTQNATVFLAAGRVGGVWYVFDEYYHSGRDTGRQRTIGEYSQELRRFLNRIGYHPTAILVDPSAAAFKTQVTRDGVMRVFDADNAVLDGIQTISTALTEGTLKVLSKCEHLRSEFPSYVWNEKRQAQGVDEPVKANDHALDALRYIANRVLNRPDLRPVPKPVGF